MSTTGLAIDGIDAVDLRPVEAGDHTVDASSATTWRIAREGARDITPMVIGVIPFGLALGASIGASSLSLWQGLASQGILAGAAQLTTVQMIEAGAAPLVIVLSALMVNARLLLYSASIAPWFADESLPRRLVLAIPVIDQLHFTSIPRFERGDLDARGRRWYYAGAGLWLVIAWIATQTLALLGGAQLPEWLGLRVAAPLALAGLLAKAVRDRPSAVAAMTAVVVTLLAAGLPFHSTVLVATLVAIVAGTVTSPAAASEEPAR